MSFPTKTCSDLFFNTSQGVFCVLDDHPAGGQVVQKGSFSRLVGGWATPLKNIKVNWDDYSQYMGK